MATLKKLMTLLSKEGLLEQRAEIILEWTNGRTDSVRGLTPGELDILCIKLTERQQKVENEMDKKRKRVIAACFGVFNKMNKTVTLDYVKAVICRRAKVDNINKISSSRLDSLYNAYLFEEKELEISKRNIDTYFFEQTNYN
ncbi:MAG: hypothetical protein WCJ72_05360 [Chryseobacterium sp.]